MTTRAINTTTTPSSFDLPPPTATQILSLSKLIPQHPPPPTPAAELLSPLLPIFNNPDIRSFLHTSDPLHIAPLSSAALFNKSFTFRASTTRAPALTLAPFPAPISHFNTNFLFCPAFNFSSLTVGTGVVQHTRKNPQIVHLHPHHADSTDHMDFRFVTDADNLLLFIFCELPHRDSVLLFYSHCFDTRSSRGTHMLLRRKAFCEALDRSPTNITATDLLPAIVLCQDETERHPCRFCGTQGPTPCSCKYEIQRGAHPLDSSQFTNSMQPHLGLFECLMNQMLFDNGIGITYDFLGTRIYFEGLVDADLAQRLADWSLTEYVKSVTEGPIPTLSLQCGDRDDVGKVNNGCLFPFWGKTNSITAQQTNLGIDSEGSTELSERVNFSAICGEEILKSIKEREGAIGGEEILKSVEEREGAMPVMREKGSRKSADVETDEKLKARRQLLANRRERNRASAQRSNLRRRLQLDTLQAELKNVQEKAKGLRLREVMLRKENLELRKYID